MKISRFASVSAIITASIAFVCSAAPPVNAQAKNPIVVHQCFVIAPRPLSTKARGTQIDYTNASSKTATSVTFAVGYRNAQHHFLRRITDEGTFSPGAEISHPFSLFNDVTFAGKQVQGCEAVAVHYSNGTRWSALH